MGRSVQWQPKGAGRMFGGGVTFMFHIDRIPSSRRDGDVNGAWELYRFTNEDERTWIGNYTALFQAQEAAEMIDRGGVHYHTDTE